MKNLLSRFIKKQRLFWFLAGMLYGSTAGATLSLPDVPLFVSAVTEPPLVLLTMGRDHKLFYEAYNDASDLDDDGQLDVGYDPTIDYFGYFDSGKCYVYDSAAGRFEPSSFTANKKCSGTDEWSGDWLNYMTTARMDAIRGVLYGGFRSIDTDTETELERTHVPQDAHSWGKEYNGTTEGYDITEYTPLDLPVTNERHLFANTTLLQSGNGEPRFRVLTNTTFRVWEWLSIERPVAGDECGNPTKSPCAPSGASSNFSIVPASATDGLSGLTRSVFDTDPFGGDRTPDNKGEMDTLDAAVNPAEFEGSDNPANINFGNADAFGQSDRYYSLVTGTLNVSTSGTYQFGVDGDDAIEFAIDLNNDGDFEDTGEIVATWYGAHGTSGDPAANSGTVIGLAAGSYNIRYRHTEDGGGSAFFLFWVPPGGGGATTLTDYFVRVEVCVPGLLEENCKLYPNGNYKPTGILHEFGESDKMKFGLLTGSYAKNLSGGVLRKTMGSITDEIDPDDGTFTGTVGIVKTIDRLREIGFGGNYLHQSNCGFIFTRKVNEGECRWWGNPIAEMMYEGVRYFAGKGSPTSDFDISSSGNDDATLGLPLPTWDDPYDVSTGGANECAKPLQLVISDINPSYDSDQVPGVNSNFGSFSGDLTGFDAEDIANNTITPNEPDVPGSHFIGQVNNIADNAPSPKTVTGLGDIRGLAPEEPTKEGSYYSSSVGYFGNINDVNPVTDDQKVTTLAVAIASPLPQFEIPVRDTTVTLVPFGKSISGGGINNAPGNFHPTNTIVDFYVQDLVNTNADNMDPTINDGLPFYRFRINYEDAEQGADHDMDAITEYSISVNAEGTPADPSDDTLDVVLNAIYEAGGVRQHMGYVISGTTADGIYLEVRDPQGGTDPGYFLDTQVPIGTTASRNFVPGVTPGATLLKDPLWYAAKWGGFVDENDNDLPDLTSEWDSDGDGIPDNYFLVTNAGKLEEQLEDTFNRITELVGASASSVAINSTVLRTNSRLYQARFSTVDWSGEVSAFSLNPDATINEEVWTATNQIPPAATRNIYTTVDKSGTPTPIAFEDTDADLNTAVGNGNATVGAALVNYLRGDQSSEQQNGGTLRDRDVLLGDIVNSSPISIANQDFAYDVLPGTEGSTYNSYLSTKNSLYTVGADARSVVIVGSNDGMVHAFQDTEDTDPANAGREIFAYVPSQLHSELFNLADPNYAHRFFVDATPQAADAFINGAWATMLVGALGNGGRALYALDVSDPFNFTVNDVMWEFDSTDNPELGHILNQPTVVRLNNGEWGVVVGNGYNSASQKAQLFILNAEDGSVITVIDTEVGDGANPNGLARPFLLDENTDRIADTVYAGDLQGNLWKFDISGSNASQWDVAFKQGNTPEPLYTALDDNETPSDLTDDTPQPITTRPTVVTHPDGGFMVLFGTGKYIETTDSSIPANPQIQTFYGIRDNGAAAGSGQAILQEQTIDAEVDVLDEDGEVINKARVVSDNLVDYSNKEGWYMDLISPVSGIQAERVIADPLVRFGRVIFTTFIPKGGCEQGGDATIMEVDAVSGARLENSVFDYNEDGVIDADDFVDYAGGQVPGSGIFIPATLASPAVISAEDAGEEYKLTSGITGEITTTQEATGSTFVGRQSWRQLE